MSAGRTLLSLAALIALSACECGEDDHVAELLALSGTVQRDDAAHVNRWQGAARGARFSIGDGVRTQAGATAELALGRRGAKLRLAASTTVRFSRNPAGTTGLEVAMGSAELEAGEDALDLDTRFGAAVLDPGARVRLTPDGDRLRVDVAFGRAVFDDHALESGQDLTIDIGGAIVEEPPPAPPEPARVEPPPPPAPEPPAPSPARVTVERRAGRGSSLRDPTGGPWESIGSEPLEVAAGTRIRVPRRASVVLRRGAQESVLEGQGEYVVGADGPTLVRALSGRVDVVASGGDVAVEVPGGTIVVRGAEGGSETRVEVRGSRGTELRTVRGRTSIEGTHDRDELQAGESAILSASGELSVGGRGPSRIDLVVSAGASVTVHDPHPPTALGVRFGVLCTGRGALELMRGRAVASTTTGEGLASVLLPSGSHSYRVRCLGGEGDARTESGSVRVLRDTGVAPLPPSAPRTYVDTDGRTYRVLYQTHLPDIDVRWPHAPSGGSYVLSVRSSSGPPRTFNASQPHVELPSGALAVGTHRLTFATAGQSSRETSLEIRFDNAMPTATIRDPADRSFAPGESVRVAGVAVPGWTAAVDGRELALDSSLRFEGTVTAPAEHAIAIELRHPSRGRHFYLRRSRGAP